MKERVLADIHCGGCGELFTPHRHNQKYCSSHCTTRVASLMSNMAAHNKRHPLETEVLITCLQCRRLFRALSVTELYCSPECEAAFTLSESQIVIPEERRPVQKVPGGIPSCRVCNRVEDACKCADRGTR